MTVHDRVEYALSEYVRKRPAQKVIGWLDEQDENNLYISVITLGEIEKGIIINSAETIQNAVKNSRFGPAR